MDLIIVGLGNPGQKYQDTLHNVGFKVVEAFAKKRNWPWKLESKFQAEVAKGQYASTTYHLLKAQTFMNLSGEAVKSYINYFQIHADGLLVITDDADLPLGRIRMTPSGGTGGHRGLKSIHQELATDSYKRLKIGIGRAKEPNIPLADYVLAPQPKEVWELLEPVFIKAERLLEMLAEESFDAVVKTANS